MEPTSNTKARTVAGLRVVESRTCKQYEYLQRTTGPLVQRHKLLRIDVETADEMLHYAQQNAHRFNVNVAANAIPNLRLPLAASKAQLAQVEDEMFRLMERTKEMREIVRGIQVLTGV